MSCRDNIDVKKMTTPQQSQKRESKSGEKKLLKLRTIVQCNECCKWRKIPTLQEYEAIRSELTNEPFVCSKRSATTCCDDPPEIEKGNTRIWLMDRPDIPKTPHGFKRRLVVRNDLSRLDCYYDTPNGEKILKSKNEVPLFLDKNPHYKEVASAEDFNFSCPKIVDDTILSRGN